MTLTRHLYAIVGLVTVLTAVSFSSGTFKTARTNPAQVVVANSAAQPVPVSVKSMPAVQIASDSNNPLTVQDKFVAGRTTIASTTTHTIDADEGVVNQTFYSVPAGKRFILRDISINIRHFASQPISEVSIFGSSGTGEYNIFIPVIQMPASGFGNSAVTGGTVTGSSWVFAPGSDIKMFITRFDPSNGASYVVSYSGYLENVPSA